MHYGLNLIIALLFYSCNSQTNSSETQLMKCIYESCLDDGSEFKETILIYENELITKKFIEFVDEGTYIGTYRKYIGSDDNKIDTKTGKSFKQINDKK